MVVWAAVWAVPYSRTRSIDGDCKAGYLDYGREKKEEHQYNVTCALGGECRLLLSFSLLFFIFFFTCHLFLHGEQSFGLCR